jgi:hypothetical protein
VAKTFFSMTLLVAAIALAGWHGTLGRLATILPQ